MADEEARQRRTDARRRRRDDAEIRGGDGVSEAPSDEQEPAPDASQGSTSGADSTALIRTGAKVALLGALIGGAVVAARVAWPSREEADVQDGEKDEDAPGDRRPRQKPDESSRAAVRRKPEADSTEATEGSSRRRRGRNDAPRAGARDGEKSAPPETVPPEAADAGGSGDKTDEQAERDDEDHSAARLARRATAQLAGLTDRTPDGILGMEKTDNGWKMTIAVVEVPRIPSTTDVLASYEVELDEDGDVRGYRAIRRYVRSQREDGGGE
jgi:hypothetical protein